VALFTVATQLCGLSTDIYLLIGFRAIQPSAAARCSPRRPESSPSTTAEIATERSACSARSPYVWLGIGAGITGLGNGLTNSTVTAILNRCADPGIAQAHILWVVAGVLLVVMVPLVFRVPEHKGSW
jgi:MFS family permease